MDERKYEQLERRILYLEEEVKQLKEGTLQQKPINVVKVKDPLSQPKPIKQIDWEKRLGQVWLPRIFLFVFLIGLIWGFKAASDMGLLNELARMCLGYITAVIALLIGYTQMQRQRLGLGQVVLAGAIIILILSTFAGTLYGYIPSVLALFLNLVWSLLGIMLAKRFSSQPIALLAGAAGLLAPFLVNSDGANVYLFVSYELLFYLLLLLFSLRQRYVYLFTSSILFFHLALFVFVFNTESVPYVVASAVIIQHLALLASFLARSLLKPQYAMVVTSFVLCLSWVALLESDLYVPFLLSSILLYGILTIYSQKKWPRVLTLTLPIVTISISLLFIDLVKYEQIGLILLLTSCAALYTGFKVESWLQKFIGTLTYTLSILLILFNGLEDIFSEQAVAWVFMFISVFFVRILINEHQEEIEKSLNIRGLLGFLFVSHALFMLHFLNIVGESITVNSSGNLTSLTISALWTLFAVAVVLYGVLRQHKGVRLFGIGLIFFTLMKIIFVDLPNVSIVIRAILFLGLGAVGIIVSRLFYRKQ
ncbi:DUF2339 domain-containing protein [Bacillus solitudinis]|uniref:DUF2339 domain-containing protein n=1 Tax=Bacillus solitudinis TaxID=2014074 RepID=UPI0018E23CF2|nr:DUF2339 domain-containing protein [Bacillus solitudinis]